MNHSKRVQSSYINQDRSGSRTRVTRLDQDIDDFHVTIQSSKPIHEQNRISHYNRTKPKYERSNYYIEINQEDGTDIDLTVKVGKQAYTTAIRNNQPYISKSNKSFIKALNLPSKETTSRITIEEQGFDGNYRMNYVSQPRLNYRSDYINASEQRRNYEYPYMENKDKYENQFGSNRYTYSGNEKKTNNPYSFKKEKEEVKSFSTLAEQPKYRDGRITKNLQHKGRNSQGQEQRRRQYTFGETEDPRNQPNHMNRIDYFKKNRPQTEDMGQQSYQINIKNVQTPKKTNQGVKQYSTHQKTPDRNYKGGSNQSPIVYPYRENEYLPSDQEFVPIFLSNHVKERQKPKNWRKQYEPGKRTQKSHTQYIRESQFDKPRKPPSQFETRYIRQKEKQTYNEPPSMKDIPAPNNKRQRIHTTYQTSENKNKNIDKPIVVPIQKLPKGYTKKDEYLKVELTKQNNKKQRNDRQKQKPSSSNDDMFIQDKQKYLDKLRRQEKSKSKLEVNRTFNHSRHSLSPECSLVTTRLHNSRINKQPCPKYLHYLDSMKRVQMKQMLGEYTFVRRYLNDQQIYEILQQLQEGGVPEKKWPMQLINIVYDRLRALKTN